MQMNAGMGSSSMYQQMGNNPSPNYASAMEMDSQGLPPTGPAGRLQLHPHHSGFPYQSRPRREELLLNLLIARRQRGVITCLLTGKKAHNR
jgi:hypothetical protein